MGLPFERKSRLLMKNGLSEKSLQDVRVMIVDDEDLLAWSIDSELKALSADTLRTASLKDTLHKFHTFTPDVAILDLKLTDGDGMELLKKWSLETPDMPVILITAHGAIDSAIAALRHGAFDYLQKPFEMRDLLVSVKRAAEVALLRQKVNSYKGIEKPISEVEILGAHDSIKDLRRGLRRIARSKADTVLIYGESGTGKELAARGIHFWSERAKHPFVEINCASIPENLLESELFGFEKGAFTDAREKKLGLFEVAKNGTIFLDEIGELPLSLQAKLLRALEYRRFRRLGGTNDIEFSARIVAATNKDLLDEASRGQFREDLYYRLDVLSIDLPTLRDRPEDIQELTEFFLTFFSKDLGLPIPKVSKAAINTLKEHRWPGNVRELKNVLLRAITLHEPKTLNPEHIVVRRLKSNSHVASNGHSQENRGPEIMLPDQGISLEAVEKSLVMQALDRALQSRTKAAGLLGISRHTLRYRMEKYGIEA
jgi:two-component system, NtrC family, response regulator AtoC